MSTTEETPVTALADVFSHLFATGESYASTIGSEAAAFKLRLLGGASTAYSNWMQGYPIEVAIPAAVLGTAVAFMVGIPLAVVLAETTLSVVAVVAIETYVSIKLSEGFNTVGLSIYDSIQQSLSIISQTTGLIAQSPTDPNTYVIQPSDNSGAVSPSSISIDPNTGAITLTTTSLDPTTGLPVQKQYLYSQYGGTHVDIPAGVEQSVTGNQNSIDFLPGAASHAFIYGDSNSISGHSGDLVDVVGSNNHVNLASGTVNVQGSVNSVTGNSDIVSVAASSSVNVLGDLDVLTIADESSVNLNGNNDVVVAGNDDSVAFLGTNLAVNAGDNFTLTTSNSNPVTVTAGAGANVSATGTISVGDNSSVTGGGEITAGDNAAIVMNVGDVTAGNDAVISLALSHDPLHPTLITTGANAQVHVTGGDADISMGDGSVLTMANSEYSLHFLNNNIHVIYSGEMIFSVDIYFNQNVMDYAYSGAHLVDPVTGLGFNRYTFSRAGSPDEIIDEGDQYNTFLTPLNFHFLDFNGDPLAFQQMVAGLAPGQNVGMVQSLSALAVQATPAPTTLHSQGTFIDRRPGETHTVSKTFDTATSTGPEIGALAVALTADSGASAGSLGLSYMENTALLHTLAKTAAPQHYVQNYDVSIVDHEGNAFVQIVTANVSGYALTSVAGPTTATINENLTTTTASGRLTLLDSDPLDVHHAHVTYVSTTGAGETSKLGNLSVNIVDTTPTNPNGTATWSYTVDPVLLASVPAGQTITETFQVSFDDGAGNTTAPQNIVVTVHTRANETAITQATGNIGNIVQTPDPSDIVKAGQIFFTDLDPNDVHVVTTSLNQAGASLGHLDAIVKYDTTGGGRGEIDWTYKISASDAASLHFNDFFSEIWKVSITDTRGDEVDQMLNGSVTGVQPTASVSLTTPTLAPLTIDHADLFDNSVAQFLSFTDSDTLIHHAISATYGGSGTPIGTLVAEIDTDTFQAAFGHYSLTYTIDPTVFDRMTDGQTVNETWHVSLDSGFGIAANQDETVTISRENLTQVTNVFDGTVQADAPVPSWSMPPGGFLFSDGNSFDAHTLTSSFKSSSTGGGPLGSFSTELFQDTTGVTSQTGVVGWNYDASNVRPTSHSPQAVTEIWTVNLDDGHGGVTSQDVSVTIQVPASSNAAPVVTTLTAGTITQNDAPKSMDLLQTATDLENDALSVVAGSFSATASDGRVLQISEQNHGITIDPAQFKNLGAGQSLSVAFGFDVTDGVDTTHGTGSLTVVGANDAPIITSSTASGQISERAATLGATAPDQTGGTLSWSDPDADDRATTSITPMAAAYSDGSGHLLNLSSGQLATLEAGFTVANAPGNTNNGSVNWNYSIADGALDFLGQGETVVLSANVAVNDGHGAIVNTPVTVAIMGTNDAPVTTAFSAGAVTQAAAPVIFANPLVHASDPDGDALSLVANSETVTSSDGHNVSYTVVNGAVTVAPSQFAYLGAGQHVDLTLGYDVTDGVAVTHGTATLEVVGVNDKPIAVTSVGTVTHNDTSAPDTFAPVTGYFSATDPDGNSLTYANSNGIALQPGAVYTVNALGEYTYFFDSVQIENKKSGGFTFNLSAIATDTGGLHSSSSSTVSITGSYADDAPYAMTWSTGGTVLEHSANGATVGTLAVTDPDGGDASPWSLVDDDGGRFAVNAVTGVVTVANGSLLDYATASDYAIVVREADGSVSDQETIHISLLPMTATLTGTSGADTLTGTSGNDVIVGLGGGDTINAGSGDDVVMAGSGHDVLDGGAGNDTISLADLTAAAGVGLGSSLSGAVTGTDVNFENVIGSQYNDSIVGTTGNNVLLGEGGNDAIIGDGGNDTIDGGPGTDIVYFNILSSAMTANLQTQTLGGAAAGTTIANVEGIISGNGNDTLTGLASAGSYLEGSGGNDILIGGTGNDTEKGDAGHDIIYGSLGADLLLDPDDAVFDYSGSPTAVALIWTGPAFGANYLGYGGFAEGDKVGVGTGSAVHFEFDLTPYNDLMSLVPNSSNTIYAGAGDDTILGGDAVDPTIHNAEAIYGGDGFDTIHPGGDGYDTVDFGAGGGMLDYALHGTTGQTYVDFEWAEPGGISTVHMYNIATGSTAATDFGVATVTGDFGMFTGTSAADIINGNSQANTIFGGGGLDVINGGGGDDAITGIGTIHGNDGNDTIVISGTDSTSAISAIYGDAGNDTIILTAGSVANVAIYGGAGNDYIDASAGSSGVTVHGDAGADIILANSAVTLSYGDSASSIAINGTIGTMGDAMGDAILGSPKIVGSNFGDTFTNTTDELHLGTGNNTVTNNTGVVYGNTGNDTIVGTTAADTIHTGGGLDTVTGGLGADQIYVDHPAGVTSAAQVNYSYGDGGDSVFGFLQGSDTINIARIPGKVDPVVTISQASGNTDVHMTWYDTPPVDGQPLPGHVDADLFLHGVLLTVFNQNQDYHVA
jgi:Ca2+-binding RTX toxin-like protein